MASLLIVLYFKNYTFPQNTYFVQKLIIFFILWISVLNIKAVIMKCHIIIMMMMMILIIKQMYLALFQ